MEWPLAEGVVAGVFAQGAGEDEGGEVGAVGLVEEAAPGVGVEAVDAFAEDGVRVEAFGGDGGEAEEEEGGGVEGLAGGDMEVVLPAGGVDGGAGGDGAVVGQDAEDALGLAPIERDGVAVGVDVVADEGVAPSFSGRIA